MAIVGRASVLVAPSFKGFQTAAGREVGKVMPVAGKQAGTAMATGMSAGLTNSARTVSTAATSVAAGASGAVAGAGTTAATGFSSRLSSGLGRATGAVTGAAGRVGTAVGATVASAGTVAGSGFVSRFATALGPLAGILSIAGAGAFIKGSVDEASGLTESVNALNVSFGDASKGVQGLGREAADNLGLSNLEFNDLAVRFSGFTDTIAGEGGNVVGTLDELTGRASDFASVMNLDVNEAAQLFQSGLAGETEPLRKFGIDLSAASVGAHAVEEGIAASASEMSESEKVQARYSLLLQETAQTQGDFANTSDSLANQQRILSSRFADMRAEIGAQLLPVVSSFVSWLSDVALPALKDFGGWVVRNKDWLVALAGGVGVALAAFVGMKILNSVNTWLATTTIMQRGLNAAMRANPIGIVVTALGLLVGGFILAYKKSETFRNIVTAAWDGIKAAASAVVDWFTGTALPFLQGVWDGIAAGATWLWENGIRPAWEGIQTGWQVVTDAISWAWNNVLKPVWDAVSGAALWLWETVLQPIFSAIWGAWSTMAGFIFDVWVNVLKLAWDAIAFVIGNLWSGVLKPIFTAIADRWETTMLAMKGVWEKYLEPVWNVVKAVATWLYNEHLKPIFDAIGDKWEEILTGMALVWDLVLKPMFEAVGSFVEDKVMPGFRTGVDMMKSAWETLKDAFAAPINWVIENVWNGGIKAAFDSVADAIGSEAKLPRIREIGAPRSDRGAGSGRGVQFRARGGYTTPGWTVVGEEGPELIDLRTPGRVYTAAQTQDLFSEDNPPHGGMWDTVGGWVSSAWSGVKSAVDWVRGGLAKAAGFVLNPLRDFLSSTLGDKGHFGGLLSDLGGNAIDKVLDWIKGEDSMSEDPKGRSMNGAQPHVNAAAWALADKVGGIRRMDAFNNSMAGGHPKGLAVDFIDSIGKLNSLADVITDTNGFGKFNYMAWQGRTWSPGRGWAPQKRGYGNDPFHRWHVHGEWYDQGGKLMPGVTQVMNGTGAPEAVLTSQQWSDIHRLATERRGDSPAVFNLYDQDRVLLGTMYGVADGRVRLERRHEEAYRS